MNASYTLRRNDKQGFPFEAVPFNEGMGGSVGGKLPKKLSAFGLQVEQACGLVPPIAPQSRDGEGGVHRVCLSEAGIQFGGIATTSPIETGFPDSMAHLNADLSVLSLQSASEKTDLISKGSYFQGMISGSSR